MVQQNYSGGCPSRFDHLIRALISSPQGQALKQEIEAALPTEQEPSRNTDLYHLLCV
jgi:hypothetical protein